MHDRNASQLLPVLQSNDLDEMTPEERHSSGVAIDDSMKSESRRQRFQRHQPTQRSPVGRFISGYLPGALDVLYVICHIAHVLSKELLSEHVKQTVSEDVFWRNQRSSRAGVVPPLF